MPGAAGRGTARAVATGRTAPPEAGSRSPDRRMGWAAAEGPASESATAAAVRGAPGRGTSRRAAEAPAAAAEDGLCHGRGRVTAAAGRTPSSGAGRGGLCHGRGWGTAALVVSSVRSAEGPAARSGTDLAAVAAAAVGSATSAAAAAAAAAAAGAGAPDHRGRIRAAAARD